ncbi:hypothetical protein [Planktotalea sp.]|uniref:hypothetical protein n=1 Tax=Planktotalea sp. TaxID=2029877 RepID=UPI00329A0E3A
MEQLITFMSNELVRLDSERLELLYNQLGEDSADNVLCRAMEELAVRVKQSEKLYGAKNTMELRKTVNSLTAIADQVGLQALAQVAQDVVNCIDAADSVALSATFSRLIRCSDQSLTAIWDIEGITV